MARLEEVERLLTSPAISETLHRGISRRGFLKAAAVAPASVVISEVAKNVAGKTESAEAAGQRHEVQIVARQVFFYDIGGRRHIFDRDIDPFLQTEAQGGQLVVSKDKDGKEEIGRSNFTAAKPEIKNKKGEVIFKGEDNISYAVSAVMVEASKDKIYTTKSGQKVAAAEIFVGNTQDPKNMVPVLVPLSDNDKVVQSIWMGRELTATQFLKIANSNPDFAKGITPAQMDTIRADAQKEAEEAARKQAEGAKPGANKGNGGDGPATPGWQIIDIQEAINGSRDWLLPLAIGGLLVGGGVIIGAAVSGGREETRTVTTTTAPAVTPATAPITPAPLTPAAAAAERRRVALIAEADRRESRAAALRARAGLRQVDADRHTADAAAARWGITRSVDNWRANRARRDASNLNADAQREQDRANSLRTAASTI